MPNTKLSDFLDALANADETTLADWCANPKEFIDRSGLSEDDKKLMKRHVLTEICQALDKEAKGGGAAPNARGFAVIKSVITGVIKSPST